MFTRRMVLACALLCAALLSPTFAADSSPVLTGNVTRVVDGDTIDVNLASGSIRIRLYGIDAPESTQPGGGDARTYLTQRVLHQAVHLEPFQQDRYSRMIAIVLLGDENINQALIREGHAWAYRKYLKPTETDYCRLEADARIAKRGLWSLPNTERIAPWEYRKRKTRTTFTDYSSETATHCIAELGKH